MNRQIIFTNGCFDVLHVGHVNLLRFCRGLAGEDGLVIVGLDTDEKIEKTKGYPRPIFPLRDRGMAIWNLNHVDVIVDEIRFFNTDDELRDMVKTIMPDIIVKGGEWRDKEVIGSEYAKHTMYYSTHGHSSTNTINKILERYGH